MIEEDTILLMRMSHATNFLNKKTRIFRVELQILTASVEARDTRAKRPPLVVKRLPKHASNQDVFGFESLQFSIHKSVSGSTFLLFYYSFNKSANFCTTRMENGGTLFWFENLVTKFLSSSPSANETEAINI